MTAASALAIIFLASVSEGLGAQGPTLLLNRLRRREFAVNVLLLGVGYAASDALRVVTISLLAHAFFTNQPSPAQVLLAVGVGSLPRLLAFLALMPYFGPPTAVVLSLTGFLLVPLSLAASLHCPTEQAFACVAGAWQLVALARRAAQRPLQSIQRWLWRRTTGLDQRLESTDLLAALTGG